METISHGGAQYRTKLMDETKAKRFAACLKANPRFGGVAVCYSERAKNPENRWYVSFNPASDLSGERILARQQSARQQRAAEQGAGYLFVLDSEGFYFHCLNTKTGEVYETTEYDCNCPDHTFRCRAAGLQCKHIVMLCEGHSEVQGWSAAA